MISLQEYKKNLERLYERLEDMDDYVLLGGHMEQEGAILSERPIIRRPIILWAGRSCRI